MNIERHFVRRFVFFDQPAGENVLCGLHVLDELDVMRTNSHLCRSAHWLPGRARKESEAAKNGSRERSGGCAPTDT